MTQLLAAPDRVLFLSAAVAAIGLIVARLEDLASIEDFGRRGILSWEVYRHRSAVTMGGWVGLELTRIYSERSFRVILVLNLTAALAVIAGMWFPWVLVPALAASVITCGLVYVRSAYGLDGSDQMTFLVHSAALLGCWGGPASAACLAAVWFVALQLTLAYFVAGAYKLSSSLWRSGRAITGILWLESYGASWAHRLLSRPRFVAAVVCWAVMLWEVSFPAVFVCGSFAWHLAMCGVAFHLSCAIVMGLNNFLFAFLACYPCLGYCLIHTPTLISR